MEFRDLTYLLEVAAAGHVGRAAARLGLTQPALTKCIARLERDLALPLLERNPKGVSLTLYGRHLVRHAERLRTADVDVRRELSELATGNAGHLRIGAGLVLAQHVLPAACITLLDKYPAITLDIRSGNSESLFPALSEGQLDVVLAGVTSTSRPGFRQVPLMEDRVVVISRKGHRLQKARRVSPQDMSRERWIMPGAGTLPAAWLDQRWRDIGIDPPACAVRSASLPTLLQIVAESDLLAFQSWATVLRTNRYGRLLRPLASEEFTWRRDFGVTTRDHGYLSPAIDRLIEALRETAARENRE